MGANKKGSPTITRGAAMNKDGLCCPSLNITGLRNRGRVLTETAHLELDFGPNSVHQ